MTCFGQNTFCHFLYFSFLGKFYLVVRRPMLEICLKYFVNGSEMLLTDFEGSLKGSLKRDLKETLKDP